MMRTDLLDVLWCPTDHGDLEPADTHVTCRSCATRYPVIDGVLSFLAEADLPELDRREQGHRDAEAQWYDSIWPEYMDRVELPAHAERLGPTSGPLLDLGSGPGRVTEYLARDLGHAVIGLDYSLESLKLLVRRCAGLEVLAVHADGRALPVRDAAMAGATSAQTYEHLRADDRRAMLTETARVLGPGARLVVSTFNYNLTFRLWKLKGNTGAREGDHMYGGDFYYVRQTRGEFRRELEAVFTHVELTTIRNIPARSIASLAGKVAGARTGERVMGWMTRTGYRFDRALERVPLAVATGFLHLATVSGRRETGPAPIDVSAAATGPRGSDLR